MKNIKSCLLQFVSMSLLSVLTLTGCGNNNKNQGVESLPASPPREKVTNVSLSTVVLKDLDETFTLPGTLEAWEDLTLSAEMAGTVHWIGPKEGDRVKKGEAILRIDPERLEAELARDQVEYELQKKRMERRRELAEEKLVSQQELEDVRQAFEQAKARLRISRVALDKSTLRSPIDGILDRLLVDRGEHVSEGKASAVVIQVNRLRVLVDVPERDIAGLSKGNKAKVFAAAIGGSSDPGISGEIIHLSYQADPATRTYLTRIAVDNRAESMRPGMIVQVVFKRRKLSKVIAVPLYSLVDRDGIKFVFVEKDGKAQQRLVRVGPIIGNMAVIENGITTGERLIVKGQQLVIDGGAVVEEGI